MAEGDKYGAPPTLAQLLSKTKRSGACLLWTGAKDKQGYGVVRGPGGKLALAHRLVYTLAKGKIPKGAVIDQTPCNRPGCVSPKHLKAVTQKVNIQRAADQNHMSRS
jgi:hypothetical protein